MGQGKPGQKVQYLAMRVVAERAGTIPLYGADLRRKYLVAITNQRVDRKDASGAVGRLLKLAEEFALLNPELRPALCLGWWTNPHTLFIDLTLLIADRTQAIATAGVFQQEATGYLDEHLAYQEIKLPRRAA